jgi:hypothetical protein
VVSRINLLTGGHKRSAFVLVFEIVRLALQFGIGRLGLLTLTFADQCQDLREAQRRFHSLCTGVLKGRYERMIGVWERQRSGAVHFHLIVVLGVDIRTGFDFGPMLAWAQQHPGKRPPKSVYSSASAALRAEWAFWRKMAPRYEFGRTELLPIRSCAEAIAYYVGAYVSIHVRARQAGDKGARIVRFIGFPPGERRASCRLSWSGLNVKTGLVEGRPWLWRHKLGAWAKRNGFQDTDQIAKVHGPRWAYHLQGEIVAEVLDESVGYPSEDTWDLARKMESPRLVASSRALLRQEGKEFVRTVAIERGEAAVKFEGGPVWAVPWWADNFAVHIPAEFAGREGPERSIEMKLYAMRMERAEVPETTL